IFNRVPVASSFALTKALANAEPGDTIQLLPGTYAGEFTLARSGTADKPITLTGTEVNLSKIDASGDPVGIQVDADHVIISNINILHAKTGISLQGGNRTDVAILGNHIEDVEVGIAARGGHRQLYINNNLL